MIEETIKGLIQLENTFIGECPIDVDNCQWIRSASGSSSVYFKKDTIDKAYFNIFIRGISNKEALQRTHIVYDRLKNYTGYGFVIIIDRLPHIVGRDEKYRTIYSFKIEYQLGGY